MRRRGPRAEVRPDAAARHGVQRASDVRLRRSAGGPVPGGVAEVCVEEDPRPAVVQGGPAREGITCVTQDDHEAVRAVAAHGLRDGRTPVVIVFPLDLDRDREPLSGTGADLPPHMPFPINAARLDGYRAAIEAAGLSWADVPVAVVARNSRQDGAEAARRLAARLAPRPLVIAMSDELALGARQALHDAHPDAAYLGWDASQDGRGAGILCSRQRASSAPRSRSRDISTG
ncbi:hypothetical protein ACQEVF_44710 [Nonomuraea polychroma]|uniref:hypothetical protein n=1 Tax=Nonomuraea polychroma TaxID=46176 RepID=UPI003D8B16A5